MSSICLLAPLGQGLLFFWKTILVVNPLRPVHSGGEFKEDEVFAPVGSNAGIYHYCGFVCLPGNLSRLFVAGFLVSSRLPSVLSVSCFPIGWPLNRSQPVHRQRAYQAQAPRGSTIREPWGFSPESWKLDRRV